MLENVDIMKIVNVEKDWLISQLKNILKILIKVKQFVMWL